MAKEGMIEDLESDLIVDLDNIEQEIVRQPSLYMKWSIKLGQATDVKDQCDAVISRIKAEIESLVGELTIKVKNQPELIGLPEGKKPTESAEKSWIIKQPEYLQKMDEMRQAEENLRSAKSNLNVLSNVVYALQQKKASLQMVCDSITAGWFIDPRITGTSRVALKENSNNNSVAEQAKHLNARLKDRQIKSESGE